MEPQTTPQTPPPQPVNPLDAGEPGEQLVCEIRRHPIGIIGVYVAAGFLLVILAVLLLVLMPHIVSDSSSSRLGLIDTLIFLIGAIIAGGYVFIMHKVYEGNRWIVSNNSITQITQTSLFDKQISQLSLADLEDITAEQDGPIAQMFHYGVISAETAAATDKFTFLFCPEPNEYAKRILAAREQFEQARRPATPPPLEPPQQ